MTVLELINLLESYIDTDEVTIEGCDCIGDVGGVKQDGEGTVLITRYNEIENA